MIIKDTLQSVHYDGDDMVFNHIFDSGHEMKMAQKFRKNAEGNWSKNREHRHVAHMSIGAWHILSKTRPDVVRDSRLLLKYFDTEEGQLFATNNRIDTGRSGQVVVK